MAPMPVNQVSGEKVQPTSLLPVRDVSSWPKGWPQSLIPLPRNSFSSFCFESPKFPGDLLSISRILLAELRACLAAQSYVTLQPHELQIAGLLCPWDFSGKNTGVGCHFLPPEDLPNPGIEPASPVPLHCKQVLYLLSHEGSSHLYPWSCTDDHMLSWVFKIDTVFCVS